MKQAPKSQYGLVGTSITMPSDTALIGRLYAEHARALWRYQHVFAAKPDLSVVSASAWANSARYDRYRLMEVERDLHCEYVLPAHAGENPELLTRLSLLRQAIQHSTNERHYGLLADKEDDVERAQLLTAKRVAENLMAASMANVAEAVDQSGMLFRAKTPWVLAVPTFFDEQPSRSGKAHSADTPYMPEPKSPTLGRMGWPQPISVWVVRGGW